MSTSRTDGRAPGRRERDSRAALGLLAVAVAVGSVFRLHAFFLARSLWLDESMLALNIAGRDFAGLLRPLDYNQLAPVLFLLVERMAVAVAGVGEQALRAFPMAAGLALPVLLFVVGRRLLGEVGGVVAAFLAALSPTLVRYSNEVKPWSSDALATVLLLWTAVGYADRPSPARGTWRKAAPLALVGVLAVLLSFPALFVAAAVTLSLILTPRIGPRARAAVAVCGALWLAAALLPYLLVYRATAAGPAQQQGYAFGLLAPGPDLGARALYALRGSLWPTFWGDGANIPRAPDAALLALGAALALGLALVARRRGAWAASLLGMPLLVTLAASLLRRYPVGVPRLMVFAAPLLILMASALVAEACARLGPRVRPALLLGAGALLLAPLVAQRVGEMRHPYRGEDARALVTAYRGARRGELEPVYVAARGLASWLFYTTNWERPDRDRLDFYARAASSGPAFENLAPRGRPVVDEGKDLLYRRAAKTEILGLGTGRQWRWPSYVQASVDEGWAANEARRIETEARRVPRYPCAWLYFTRLSERSYKPLSWALRDEQGAWLDELLTAPGGLVARWCFYERPNAPAASDAARGAGQATSEPDTDGESDAGAVAATPGASPTARKP